jgi:hypothetical protein
VYRKPRLSVRSACNLGLRFGVLRADRVAPFGRPDRGGDCQARIPCPARVAPASARDRKIAFKSNWRCRSERPANLRVVDKINFNDKSWQLEVGLIATDIPEHWASDRSARTPLSPHSYRPPPAARRDRFRPTAPSRSRLTIAAVGADPRGYCNLGGEQQSIGCLGNARASQQLVSIFDIGGNRPSKLSSDIKPHLSAATPSTRECSGPRRWQPQRMPPRPNR